MMSAMREFEWSYEIGMYAGTAVGMLGLILVGSAVVLLVKILFKASSSRRSERP